MNIVLDTNVLISAFLFGGQPRTCLKRCISGEDTLFISGEILDEVSGVLSRPKFNLAPEAVSSFINALVEIAVIEATPGTTKMCRDPKDDMFLDCALHANTNFP